MEYSSFLNYDIFETLVSNFDIDRGQDELRYPEHLAAYVRKHTIEEFIRVIPKLGEFAESSENLTLILDVKQTRALGEIIDFHYKFAEIMGVNPSALQLCDIGDCCVLVTFKLLGFVARIVFAGDKRQIFSQSQLQEFQALAILYLECKDYQWDFKGQL